MGEYDTPNNAAMSWKTRTCGNIGSLVQVITVIKLEGKNAESCVVFSLKNISNQPSSMKGRTCDYSIVHSITLSDIPVTKT